MMARRRQGIARDGDHFVPATLTFVNAGMRRCRSGRISGIEPRIVKKRRPGEGRARDPQAPERWTIERTNAWLHNNRRITIRWERRPELYLAFAQLACAVILCHRLEGAF